MPGVYVVYAEGDAPLYVGVAVTQSIRKRWESQHLKPRAGGSALRRTLGVHLALVETKLRTTQGRYVAARPTPDPEEFRHDRRGGGPLWLRSAAGTSD
jgi:hypothetical protein